MELARLSPTLNFIPEQELHRQLFFQHLTKMLSRAIRGGHRALPFKSHVNVSIARAKRKVTTDAASSHAEKEHVPAVSQARQSNARAID